MKNLKPDSTTLAHHQASKLQVTKMSASKSSNFEAHVKVRAKDTVKTAVILLNAHVAVHSSVRSIDHLSEMLRSQGAKSVYEDIKIHRTKCSMIIKNVIGASLREELRQAMQGRRFSLMIDESTDVSTKKLLSVCARFFDQRVGEVVEIFLGNIEVVSCTGELLFEAMKEVLNLYGLEVSNTIGFSSDGAANVAGQHNSAWSRVKEEAPDCVQLKCTCHSLQLCVQHSFEHIPGSIGLMLTEIPSYFSRSSLRREDFIELFKVLNDGASPFNSVFAHYCATRWLGRGAVIENIRSHWWDLKAYFDVAQNQAPVRDRYRVRELYGMLSDPLNLLYFEFLSPIIREMETLNRKFQTSHPDMNALLKMLELQVRSVRARVYDDRGKSMHILCCDYGVNFEEQAAKLDSEQASMGVYFSRFVVFASLLNS